MKKLVALLVAMMMLTAMLPVMAMADSTIDTSEHVVITYLVTGDIPTNRTEEVLAKINEKLTEKVNAELKIRWIEWTDWTTKYNLALATQSGDIDLIGTATDWLNAWPNIQKGAFLPLSEFQSDSMTGSLSLCRFGACAFLCAPALFSVRLRFLCLRFLCLRFFFGPSPKPCVKDCKCE